MSSRWWPWFKREAPIHRSLRRRESFHLELEVLEDRIVPASPSVLYGQAQNALNNAPLPAAAQIVPGLSTSLAVTVTSTIQLSSDLFIQNVNPRASNQVTAFFLLDAGTPSQQQLQHHIYWIQSANGATGYPSQSHLTVEDFVTLTPGFHTFQVFAANTFGASAQYTAGSQQTLLVTLYKPSPGVQVAQSGISFGADTPVSGAPAAVRQVAVNVPVPGPNPLRMSAAINVKSVNGGFGQIVAYFQVNGVNLQTHRFFLTPVDGTTGIPSESHLFFEDFVSLPKGGYTVKLFVGNPGGGASYRTSSLLTLNTILFNTIPGIGPTANVAVNSGIVLVPGVPLPVGTVPPYIPLVTNLFVVNGFDPIHISCNVPLANTALGTGEVDARFLVDGFVVSNFIHRFFVQTGDPAIGKGSESSIFFDEMVSGLGLASGVVHTFGLLIWNPANPQAYLQAGSLVTLNVTEFVPLLVSARLQPDPTDSSKLALYVQGTSDADRITIVSAPDGAVRVHVNDEMVGSFRPTGHIIVFGLEGDDSIVVSSGVRLPALLFGGPGKDFIVAGGGPTVLVGEDDDDILTSGSSRSIMIGGNGKDKVFGSLEDDVLIGGLTALDGDPRALSALLTAWSGAASQPARVATLSASLNSRTVFDDATADLLTGGSGHDWLFTPASETVITPSLKPTHVQAASTLIKPLIDDRREIWE